MCMRRSVKLCSGHECKAFFLLTTRTDDNYCVCAVRTAAVYSALQYRSVTLIFSSTVTTTSEVCMSVAALAYAYM
jgi:hypothetical protein